MPRDRVTPPPFEPEALELSTDRYLTAGLIFMVLLIAGFVSYRVREPGLRRTAAAQQQASYRTIGRTLFAGNCASCHGRDATGGSAPVLNSQQFLKAATDPQIQQIVSSGISGSEMPAWSFDFGGTLTSEQIQQITSYLRSLQAKAPSVPAWRSGAATTTTTTGTTVPTGPGAGQVVRVDIGDTSGLNGSMYVRPDRSSAPSGTVTFVVKNSGTIDHELIVLQTDVPFDQLPVVDGGDPPAPVSAGADKVSEDTNVGETGDPNLKPGDTRTFTIKNMKPGHYVLVCNLAKHYGMGMRAAFTVT